jgi:hypothetical protein
MDVSLVLWISRSGVGTEGAVRWRKDASPGCALVGGRRTAPNCGCAGTGGWLKEAWGVGDEEERYQGDRRSGVRWYAGVGENSGACIGEATA